MSILKAEGIILRSMKFRETSKVLTLFTREHGVVKVNAKGSRSSKSRLGATLEPLNVVHIVYYHKDSRDFQILSAADLIETFPSLPTDLEKWAYACACGELVLRAHPAAAATPKLYPILHDTLRVMNAMPSGQDVRCCFWGLQMKLLGIFGVAPNLRRCSSCEKPLNPEISPTVQFYVARGGFFCGTCDAGAGAMELSAEAVAWLANFQTLPAAKLSQIIVSIPAVSEIEKFYRAYFGFHLEEIGKLQALKFVRDLRQKISA